MEERPSDSQNESANELPQAVPQPITPAPVSADQSAATQRSENVGVPEPTTATPVVSDRTVIEPAVNESIIPERTEPGSPSVEVVSDTDTPETQSPDGEDLRELLNQPRQDRSRQNQAGQSPKQGQPRDPNQPRQQNQPGQERSRDPNQPRQQQNQPGQERSGQPNQPRQQNGQRPGQERPGNERPGQEKAAQERPGQERPGPEKQPRDPNQPQKQNQPGHERPGHERPGNERSGNERSGRQNQQPRDSRPEREMDIDGRDEDRQPTLRQPDRAPTGPREETIRETDDRLVIGITLGDYNGIGPEVILKALQYNRLQKICTPVIYGSMRVLNRYRNLLEMKDWNLNGIQQVEQASHKLTNVITCWPDQNQEIQPGKVTAEAGQAAFACLQRAVEDLREGKLDAIVTAPINKHNIQSEEFKFPGHTEYLAEAFSVGDNLMFLVSERLRVGVVTGHVPLGRVRQNITRERILQKWTMMNQSLRLDFGIDKPRIAVLGLNPHAGEEGLLGNEEQEIVKPLLKQLQDKGNLVYGPFPADGFFGTRAYLKFDAVLAMYHDQGLIPFKAIAFEEGVNFTAGMPVVRTSPDHGTAYDIAGKNIADETSMLQAIYTACDVARRRRETAEIMAGALKPKRERAVER